MNAVNMEEPSPGLASADKRRSKLGYHRTSVACVHCRRRKIRCLSTEKDSGGPCLNCVRLKKECVYNPVEHPTETGSQRSQSLSKKNSIDDRKGSVSSSSDPTTPSMNEIENFGFRSSVDLSSPGYASSAMGVGHSQDVHSPHGLAYPFPPPARTQTWSAGYGGDQMPDATYSMSAARPNSSTRAMSVGGQHMAYTDPNTGSPWPTMRSASFGGISGVGASQYADPMQQGFQLPYAYQSPQGSSFGHSPSTSSGANTMTPPTDQMISPFSYNSQQWLPTSGPSQNQQGFGGQWVLEP